MAQWRWHSRRALTNSDKGHLHGLFFCSFKNYACLRVDVYCKTARKVLEAFIWFYTTSASDEIQVC
jgi:hypothetical protein